MLKKLASLGVALILGVATGLLLAGSAFAESPSSAVASKDGGCQMLHANGTAEVPAPHDQLVVTPTENRKMRCTTQVQPNATETGAVHWDFAHTGPLRRTKTNHTGQTGTKNAPFDAKFLDSMIQHHQGAIDMAKEALTKAEHSEIKTLANHIITNQQREITKMQNWRKQWYPNLGPTGGMMMPMGDMEISDDTSKPFDQRFIEAMIPHHQAAIDMAKEALTKAEHSEIKTLAHSIISAQTKEIQKMQKWHKKWYETLVTPTATHPGH
jgi:uncharacterized protein (DUF305 family)